MSQSLLLEELGLCLFCKGTESSCFPTLQEYLTRIVQYIFYSTHCNFKLKAAGTEVHAAAQEEQHHLFPHFPPLPLLLFQDFCVPYSIA